MKLKKKIISSVLTLAMMATMILGSSSLAIAQTTVPGATPETTVTTAKIDLENTLYASGDVYPDVDTFSWEITPVSFQPSTTGSSDGMDASKMPRVSTTKVDGVSVSNGTSSDTVTKVDGSIPVPDPGYKTVAASVYIDFPDSAAATPIGVYTYRIQQNAYAGRPELSHDTTEYFLDVYVVNQLGANGVPTGNITIYSLTEWTADTKPDGNDEDNPDDSDSKKDITTQVTTDTVGAPAGGDYNIMSLKFPFRNNRYETKDLTVEKYVIGNYANTNDNFTYNVTVSDSAVAAGTMFNVEYTPAGQTIGDGNNPTTITVGTATPITLKHGQTFKIKGLSKVATFSVTEQGASTYRGAAAYTAGHTAATLGATVVKDDIAIEGNNNSSLAEDDLDDSWIYDSIDQAQHGLGAAIAISGTMQTQVAVPTSTGITTEIPAETLEDVKIVFTNERTVVTPTGLVMTYWPYIVAVVAVLAAVGIFVGVKLKKKKSGVDTNTNTGAGL